MKAIEKYRRNGLERPISFHPNIWVHLLLLGVYSSSLIFFSFLVVIEDEVLKKLVIILLIIAIGVSFVVFCLVSFAWLRSGQRGILELSKEGIYMSHIGIVLPWQDISLAWITTIKNKGIKMKSVDFFLHNASQHEKRMSGIGRLLISMGRLMTKKYIDISKKIPRIEFVDAVDLGLKFTMFATLIATDSMPSMSNQQLQQLSSYLKRLHDYVTSNPDVICFAIPFFL